MTNKNKSNDNLKTGNNSVNKTKLLEKKKVIKPKKDTIKEKENKKIVKIKKDTIKEKENFDFNIINVLDSVYLINNSKNSLQNKVSNINTTYGSNTEHFYFNTNIFFDIDLLISLEQYLYDCISEIEIDSEYTLEVQNDKRKEIYKKQHEIVVNILNDNKNILFIENNILIKKLTFSTIKGTFMGDLIPSQDFSLELISPQLKNLLFNKHYKFYYIENSFFSIIAEIYRLENKLSEIPNIVEYVNNKYEIESQLALKRNISINDAKNLIIKALDTIKKDPIENVHNYWEQGNFDLEIKKDVIRIQKLYEQENFGRDSELFKDYIKYNIRKSEINFYLKNGLFKGVSIILTRYNRQQKRRELFLDLYEFLLNNTKNKLISFIPYNKTTLIIGIKDSEDSLLNNLIEQYNLINENKSSFIKYKTNINFFTDLPSKENKLVDVLKLEKYIFIRTFLKKLSEKEFITLLDKLKIKLTFNMKNIEENNESIVNKIKELRSILYTKLIPLSIKEIKELINK